MSIAQTDNSISRRKAIRGSARLLARLQRHHGHDEPEPVPAALPPIPNEVIAGACKIAFPPLMLNRVNAIQHAVLHEFPGITITDLKSERRTAKVVKPRQLAMYLAKTMTLQSLPEIGRRFGGRDHTTVLHAVRKIEELVVKDPALAAQIERIKENVPEVHI